MLKKFLHKNQNNMFNQQLQAFPIFQDIKTQSSQIWVLSVSAKKLFQILIINKKLLVIYFQPFCAIGTSKMRNSLLKYNLRNSIN